VPWFYVDDAFADSRPVMQLDAKLRNEAIGLWVRCGAWSAKEETDGRVPLDVVKALDGTPRLIRALHSQAGLWDESSPDSWRKSREILFKNWEKWQKTRAENEAKRKADAERQARYRRSKKGRNYVAPSAISSQDENLSQSMSQRDSEASEEDSANSCHAVSHSAPTQTRPDPTLNPLVTSSGGVTSVNAWEATAPPKCKRHKANSPTPCAACKARREWEEAQDAARAADELEHKRRLKLLRENCPRCEGTNTFEDESGFVHKCNHEEAVPHV